MKFSLAAVVAAIAFSASAQGQWFSFAAPHMRATRLQTHAVSREMA